MELFGLLPVYKPRGPTSTEVMNTIKKHFSVNRIGHTGTLDPFAEGLLVFLIGKATRLSEYYQKLPKEYITTGLLGTITDTYDITGKPLTPPKENIEISKDRLLEVLETFKGKILQTPPPFSAKKIKGKRAYKLARQGKKVSLKPVEVSIYELELLEFNPPYFTLRTVVSGGTYIRSLIHDIGQKLGVGATTYSLKRTKIGSLSLEEAFPLEELLNKPPTELENILLPPDKGLDYMPEVELSLQDLSLVKNGRKIPLREDIEGELFRLKFKGNLVALARKDKNLLKPEKVFISPIGN
ncbi:MAG: tRNA pseudouridine(55) synthase TruB [Aquificae bacterium]|nr:tRNA pseudouridine(55) synthase TruB [Aquificota bacterium]